MIRLKSSCIVEVLTRLGKTAPAPRLIWRLGLLERQPVSSGISNSRRLVVNPPTTSEVVLNELKAAGSG